jgi:hypothetical protein
MSINKFVQYQTNPMDLVSELFKYYWIYTKLWVGKNDNLMIELSESNLHIRIEYEYKKKRLDTIKFLEFKNPISNFEQYNFIVNGFKIQECVSFVVKKYCYQIASIHKKNGGSTIPFTLEDSDFYWIHERLVDYFFLVPASVLYEYGYLSSPIKKGKTTINIDTNRVWLLPYNFSYKTINSPKESKRLKKMLKIM